MLQKECGRRIQLFTTTNESKNKIVDKLQVALENETIKLQRNDELLTQLRAYKQELTRSGKITYNAPSGYNDDAIISTAICYDSIRSNKGSYTIQYR